MIIIGMDDTDVADSRGTGALARHVAHDLAPDYRVQGVIRQQLLRDPRVPCTRNNSSKALLLEDGAEIDLAALAGRVRALMLADFVPGSDPGLCVARTTPQSDSPGPWPGEEVIDFGRRAQRELLTQAEARALAERHGIYLEGLGGDEMGVIGALAAVGLTAWGEAGRYIQLGDLRAMAGDQPRKAGHVHGEPLSGAPPLHGEISRRAEWAGAQPIEALLAAGVDAVQTADGRPVTSGLVQAEGLRPARRGGRAVAVVEWRDGCWIPIRLE